MHFLCREMVDGGGAGIATQHKVWRMGELRVSNFWGAKILSSS